MPSYLSNHVPGRSAYPARAPVSYPSLLSGGSRTGMISLSIRELWRTWAKQLGGMPRENRFGDQFARNGAKRYPKTTMAARDGHISPEKRRAEHRPRAVRFRAQTRPEPINWPGGHTISQPNIEH